MIKIALVHDYLKEYGGAESVLETLSDIFPQAPIFTTIYRPQFLGPHRSRLEAKWSQRIHQSFFGHLPFAEKFISPFRFLSPLAFKSFDFSSYDLIISSATGAFFPNSLNKKSAKLFCYCHTPPRYLYNLSTARDLTRLPKIVKIIFAIIAHFYRLLDFKFAQNVDQFIANSRTTAARIQKFYRRDSLVINPPVVIPNQAKRGIFSAQSCKTREHCKMAREPYFLTGGRFAHAKRFDIALLACNQLKLPLKIFGRDFANLEAKLKSLSGPTIEFLGEITNADRLQLMSQAKAFIFSSDNEDFGIVPVEAMACGCPVIAYRSGGATETILDGKTGVFFDELTPDSCAQAIKKFLRLKIPPQACLTQAKKFSTAVFVKKIKKLTNF